MKQKTLNNQDGIALGPILFIIAILAIIAAAIAAGNVGFNANSNTESSKTVASTIVTQMQNVRDGISGLLANGCLDTQINYANQYYSSTNLSAPTDHSCDVFDPRGANLTFPLFDSLLAGQKTSGYAGRMMLGIGQVVGFGYTDLSNANDPNAQSLVLVLQMYTPTRTAPNNFAQAVCQQVNTMAGITSSLPTTYNDGSGPFEGDFTIGTYLTMGFPGTAEFANHDFGCFAWGADVQYDIYMVVEAR